MDDELLLGLRFTFFCLTSGNGKTVLWSECRNGQAFKCLTIEQKPIIYGESMSFDDVILKVISGVMTTLLMTVVVSAYNRIQRWRKSRRPVRITVVTF